MIRLRLKNPAELMKDLLTIRSQAADQKIVIDIHEDHFSYATEALAYKDVFEFFAPNTERALDIEINLKAYVTHFFLIVASPIPKDKIFIGDGVFMRWVQFNEYVYGTESEQDDMITYYNLVEESLNQVLMSRYEMDLDEVRHYVDDTEIWEQDDIINAIDARELSESDADKILLEQPKLKPEPIVVLNDSFSQYSAEKLNRELDTFRQAGFSEATLILNSPGGNVYSYFAIRAAINRFGNKLRIIAIGLAASAGGFILGTGPVGGRIASRDAVIMIHQFRGFSDRKTLGFNKRLGDEILDELHKNSRITKEELREMLNRDTFLSAQQALEIGIIDTIL